MSQIGERDSKIVSFVVVFPLFFISFNKAAERNAQRLYTDYVYLYTCYACVSCSLCNSLGNCLCYGLVESAWDNIVSAELIVCNE